MPPRLCWGQWLSRGTLPAEDCGWGFRLVRAGAEESEARKGLWEKRRAALSQLGRLRPVEGQKAARVGQGSGEEIGEKNTGNHRHREGQKRCE